MPTPDTSLLKFPCDFPIKIMGPATDAFELAALTIIHKHCPDLAEGAISTRRSKDGNYLGMTVIIHATSQAQLDAIYSELSAHELVLMAL
jgi:uncharacterized protein